MTEEALVAWVRAQIAAGRRIIAIEAEAEEQFVVVANGGNSGEPHDCYFEYAPDNDN